MELNILLEELATVLCSVVNDAVQGIISDEYLETIESDISEVLQEYTSVGAHNKEKSPFAGVSVVSMNNFIEDAKSLISFLEDLSS